ncbi:MAG: ribosome maturation factor RimP [Janthinobacterium lividum]
MTSLDETVAGVLTEVVGAAGLVLEEVSVAAAGRRRVVRVVVDLPGAQTGEVDLDQVATVSRAVSQALDDSDVLGDAEYTLEVTSPGVDRPLTTRQHWARARGRLVRAVLSDGTALLARVVSTDDSGVHVTLEPEMVKGRPPRAKDVGAPRDLGWSGLVRGEVQVEFRKHDESDDDHFDDESDDDDFDDESDDDDFDDESADEELDGDESDDDSSGDDGLNENEREDTQ